MAEHVAVADSPYSEVLGGSDFYMYDPLPVIARFFICLALCSRAHHAFAVEAATGEMRGPGLAAPSALSFPAPRTLDLTHINPVAFATALGKNENRIFAFVRDEIAYEPYPGCLRGPQGTPLARAGNSVDRAALLAALMQAAGKHVRFAHGDLDEKAATQLVQSTWADRPAGKKASASAPDPVKKAFEAFQTARYRDFHLATEQLKKAPLVRSELTIPSMADLVRTAKAHFWVQYEKEGSWIDMDPSFADASIGHRYAGSPQIIEKLPENLFHKVTMHVLVDEVSVGGPELKPASREILRYTSRASDLAAVDLVLMHRGPGGKKTGGLAGALSGAGKDNGRVKPALFTPNGKWITGSEFGTRAPKSTVGALGSMGDMLTGGGTRKPVPVAVAERLEFEFTAPDGSKETVVRDVFDLVGPARRGNDTPFKTADISSPAQPVAAELVGSVYDIFFTNGRLDDASFEDLAIEPRPTGKKHVDLSRMLRRINITFTALADRLAQVKWGDRSVTRMYPDSPRVTILALTGLDKGPALSIDLRRNQLTCDYDWSSSRRFLLIATFARHQRRNSRAHFYRDNYSGAAHQSQGRSDREYEHDLRKGIGGQSLPILLWKNGQEEMPFAVLSKDTRARLTEEHRTGSWLLAPARELNPGVNDRFAWWKIDPRSGVTMAVTDDGLHQTGTEQVTVTTTSDDTIVVTVGTEAEGGTILGDPAFTQEFEDMEDAKSYIDWLHSQGYPGGGEGLSPPGVIPQSADIPTAAFP